MTTLSELAALYNSTTFATSRANDDVRQSLDTQLRAQTAAESSFLKEEQLEVLRAQRAAALSAKQLNDQNRRALDDDRAAKLRAEAELLKQRTEEKVNVVANQKAAQERLGTVSAIVGNFQGGVKGTFLHQGLDTAVADENIRRAKAGEGALSVVDEHDFRVRLTKAYSEDLKNLAKKDTSYAPLAALFDSDPANPTLRKRPTKEGLIVSALKGIKDVGVNAVAGGASVAGGIAAIGSAGAGAIGWESAADTLAKAGVDANKWASKTATELLSREALGRKKTLEEADGFLKSLGVVLSDPLQVVDLLAGSAAFGGLGGVTARVATKALTTGGALRVGSATAAGAASANDANVAAEKAGLTGGGRALAIAGGAGYGAVIGAAGGAGPVEQLVGRAAGVTAAPAATTAVRSSAGQIAARNVLALGSETLEEGLQNPAGSNAVAAVQGQSFRDLNLFDTKAAALGLAAGGVAKVGNAAADLLPNYRAAKALPPPTAPTPPAGGAASTQPTAPAASVQPAAPAASVQPAAPAASVQPTAPAASQPAAPAASVQPAAPAASVQPAAVPFTIDDFVRQEVETNQRYAALVPEAKAVYEGANADIQANPQGALGAEIERYRSLLVDDVTYQTLSAEEQAQQVNLLDTYKKYVALYEQLAGGTVAVDSAKKPVPASQESPSQQPPGPQNSASATPSLASSKTTSGGAADPDYTVLSQQVAGVIKPGPSSRTVLADAAVVLANSPLAENPDVKRIIEAVSDINTKLADAGIDPAIVFEDTPDADGTFQPGTEFVTLNDQQNGVDKVITLVHEAVHRMTVAALVRPRNAKERQARDTVQQVMSALASETPNDTRVQNTAEFIANLRSDPVFAARVEAQTLPRDRDVSALAKITDAIKTLFVPRPDVTTALGDSVDALYSAEQLPPGDTQESVWRYLNKEEADAARRGAKAAATVLERTSKAITESGIALEVKRLNEDRTIAGLAKAARPAVDRLFNIALRGGTTLTGAARIFDRDASGLVGGKSQDVIRTLEEMHGTRQTSIEEDNRALNAIGDFDVAGRQRILELYTKLNLVNKGRGYNPNTEPKTDEESELQAEYKALPSSERAAINTTHRRLKEQHDKFWDLLIDSVAARNGSLDMLETLNTLRKEQAQQVAFYGPITRSGDYTVAVKNEKEETIGLWQSNSYAEIQAIQQELDKQKGPDDFVTAIRRTRDAPTATNTDSLGRNGALGLADQFRAMTDIPEAVRELVAERIMDAQAKQSANSVGRYKIARKGVAGGEVTLAGILGNAQAMTNAIIALEFAPRVKATVDEMDVYTRSQEGSARPPEDVTRANMYAATVKRHAELALNPIQAEGAARALLSTGHMWAMAATPAVAVIQMLSLLTNTVPFLNAANRGFGAKATVDVAGAMKETFTNAGWVAQKRNLDSAGLEGRDKELYDLREFLRLRGGRQHDDSLRSTSEDLAGGPLAAKIKNYASWFQNRSDALVVGATAIAAYDTSKRVNPGFTQEEHYEWVRQAVNYSQPSNGQYDKPVWAKEGNFGKVAYMLRTYPIAVVNGMIADIKDISTLKGAAREEATRRFLGQHLMMVALGGATATPITYGLAAAVAALGQADEEDPLKKKLNAEQYLTAAVRETMGDDAASVFSGGVIPGAALSGSVEISPLVVFRMPDELFSREGVKDLAFQLTGPIGSAVARGAGGDSTSTMFQSIMGFAPRALQGPAAAVKLIEDDMKALSKNGDILTEVTPTDVFLRVIGLQSRAIQEAGAEVRILGKLQRKAREEQRFVTRAAAIARAAGGDSEAEALIEEHNTLYAAYPTFQVKESSVDKAEKLIEDVASNERDRLTRFERNSATFQGILGRTTTE